MLSALYHRPDALRAQNLANLSPIFHHQHLLQVGAEGAVCGAEGEAPIMTENRRLAALFALCHVQDPFFP